MNEAEIRDAQRHKAAAGAGAEEAPGRLSAGARATSAGRRCGGERARRRAGGAALLIAGLIAGASASAQKPARGDPRPAKVVAISVQPAPTRRESDFLGDIAQKTGQPLSREAVRRSIQNLFATGAFADITAIERPAPGGISLRFATRPNYFIGSVRIKNAPDPPSNTELADISELELGQLFTRARLKLAIVRMKQRLAVYNYRQTHIKPELALRPARAEVELTFLVTAGELARVGQISFTGSGPAAAVKLLRATRLRAGKQLPQSRLRHALRRLHRYYARLGRLAASIRLRTRYHAAKNLLDLAFSIHPGPLVTVATSGMKLANSVLKKQVPIFQEHAADEELIDEGRRNLQNYLQKQGYYEARVAFARSHPRPNWLRIVYRIHAGPKQRLDAVQFRGNHYFSEDDLEAQIAERPTIGWLPGFIPGARGRFSHNLMRGDAATITALYQANGFSQVKVEPKLQQNYHGKSGQLAVIFQIQEGPQVLVRKLTLTGNHAFSAARIENLLTSAPGEPYSSLNVVTDCDQILSHYYDAGYLQAQCHSQVTAARQPQRMDVHYIIREGPAIAVNRVFIAGERFVKPSVVAHEVKLKPGQPLSQTAMLTTQRRLYNLDLFTGVNVAMQNPEGQLPAKNVIVNVHEASRYSFSEGVGLQVQSGTGGPRIPSNVLGETGWSPLLSFNMTRLAMTGRPQTLSLKTAYGTLERRAGLDYSLPRFLNHRTLKADLSALYDDRFDLLTFRAVRRQVAAQLTQQPAIGLRLFYRLAFRRIQVLNLVVAPQEVPVLSRPVDLAITSLGLIRDHRDNPLDTHQGSYDTLTFAAANSFGGSDFTRLLGEHAFYIPLGRHRQFVLANATRIGVETPFGPVEAVTFTNPVSHLATTTVGHIIPLPERFFSGGADSLRGFGFDQAGPRDPVTGFPVGGDDMFINNLEFRFPLIEPNIGGVAFYDAGNVYSSLGGMLRGLARVHEPSFSDLNYTTHTLGLGVRYKTPIGPVRIDVGYDLNPPVIQNFLQPPNQPARQQVQSLPHLHFYFSIGQTF